MFLALKNQNKLRTVKKEQGHSTSERLKQLHLPFLNEKQFLQLVKEWLQRGHYIRMAGKVRSSKQQMARTTER